MPASVASRAASRSANVNAPSGVTAADHVAIHTLMADTTAAAPVWNSLTNFVLRYQRSKDVGGGIHLHWAVYDSDGNDVSAPSTFAVASNRPGLATGTQSMRVIDTDGYDSATGVSSDGIAGVSSLTLPSITFAGDNRTAIATVTAGNPSTVTTGPSGWTQDFGLSSDQYLYSLVGVDGNNTAQTVTYSSSNSQTATVQVFLPATVRKLVVGANEVSALRIGSTAINRAYYGDVMVFDG